MPSRQQNGIEAFLDSLRVHLQEGNECRNGESHIVLVLRVAEFDNLILLDRVKEMMLITQELSVCLAASLRNQDVVIAIGDRDLGLLLPRLQNEAMLGLATSKIKKVVKAFEERSGLGFNMRIHIGASFIRLSSDPCLLYRQAYMAMLQAVKHGETLVLFSQEHHETTKMELEIEDELNKSAENFAFELYCQPQLALATNTLTSAEILIRWNHERLGFVSPGLFIPIAEKMGLICQITEWVIHKSLNFQSELLQIAPDFGLSINISPLNLKDENFPQFVEEALGLWGLVPELLMLELTEGAMLENPAEALRQLQTLKGLGIKLSVDDFGTGYSSLQYLSRLPVDEVKIDQTFIRNMQSSHHDKGIVDTIVDLARNFNLETVAEGVEDVDSLDYLRRIGCDKAQGYYVSRPIPQAEFMKLIAATRQTP